MKRRVIGFVTGLTVLLLLFNIGPSINAERALTTGDAALEGRWLDESTATGQGFVFSNATVVGEKSGDINLGATGDRLYAPAGGGIRDMGAINLEDIAQAPTSGYVAEIDLTTGSWAGSCFCLYTREVNYAKFQINEHYFAESASYGDQLGRLSITWYLQDDGSRGFTGQSDATIIESTVDISDTVKASVRISSTGSAEMATIGTFELYNAAAGNKLEEKGVNESKVLGTVEVTVPDDAEWIYLEFSYSDKDVEGMALDDMAVYYYDDHKGDWVKCGETGVDKHKKIVWANVTHTTIFAAIGEAMGDDEGEGDDGNESPGFDPILIMAALMIVSLVAISTRRKR